MMQLGERKHQHRWVQWYITPPFYQPIICAGCGVELKAATPQRAVEIAQLCLLDGGQNRCA